MNKKAITLTIFIILGMIIGVTLYKTNKNHNDNLIKVVENEFLYQAKLCNLNDLCSRVITLKNLYDNNYLTEKLTNPITKKYYDENSSINLDTMEINLIS